VELVEKALDILLATERSVADLACKAVEQRDYRAAATLTDLARELRDVVEHIRPTEALLSVQKAQEPGAVLIPGKISEDPLRSARRRPKKGEFPKFLRDDRTLYKLGWSKTKKATYEHKAPQSALSSLVKKLGAVGANRRRFTVEDIIPLQNPSEESEVPSYQVYLCLAWLRTTGLLFQHGRQGYSMTHPSRFETEVANHWQRILLKQDT
jgi:hypothetical protein